MISQDVFLAKMVRPFEARDSVIHNDDERRFQLVPVARKNRSWRGGIFGKERLILEVKVSMSEWHSEFESKRKALIIVHTPTLLSIAMKRKK